MRIDSGKNIAILLIPPCLAMAAWALAWGWADLGAVSPRLAMLEWREQVRAPNEDEWRKARDRLENIYRVHPFNASYSADMARVYEWRGLDFPLWSGESKENRARAIDFYRKALARRPTWAFAWVNLARTKVLNQEVDKEVFTALEKAMVFSPWAPDVQLKVIELGLALWNDLPDVQRAQVIATVRRAIRHDNGIPLIVQTARRYDRLEHLLPLMTDERRKALPSEAD